MNNSGSDPKQAPPEEVKDGLKSREMLGALQELMKCMHSAESLDTFLEKTLEISLRLFKAERGHFIWWDVASHRSVIRALIGECSLRKGDKLPERGVVHNVLTTKKPCLIPDVPKWKSQPGNDFYETNVATQCEMAVCLEFDDGTS